MTRKDDADRLDLIVAGVCRIQHPRRAIEADLAVDSSAQFGFKHDCRAVRRRRACHRRTCRHSRSQIIQALPAVSKIVVTAAV